MNWFKNLFSKASNEPDPMKYLIVGLGNMGADYDNTRHNIGFDVLDQLADGKTYEHERLGDYLEMRFKGRTLCLLKPSTYMNLSGKAVHYWMQKKKIQAENLLIIVDDKNLPFGQIRMRNKGSDGGHNGLKSLNEHLGNSSYARLRFGIGNEFAQGRQVDFVLGKWTDEEKKGLPEPLKKSVQAIKSFCTIGIGRTMSQFNTKPKKKKDKEED